MMTKLTMFLLRRRMAVLAALAVLAIAGAAAGVTLFSKLASPGFDYPDSPSGRATAVLARDFAQGAPDLALLVRVPAGADSPAAATSLTLLPVVFALLGNRIESGRLIRRPPHGSGPPSGAPKWWY